MERLLIWGKIVMFKIVANKFIDVACVHRQVNTKRVIYGILLVDMFPLTTKLRKQGKIPIDMFPHTVKWDKMAVDMFPNTTE